MKYKTVWTGTLHTKTYILDNSSELRAERFEISNIHELSNCKHIRTLTLCSNKGDKPIDLSLLIHIEDLESLKLEKVNYSNLSALSKLPNFESLSIEKCKCFKFSDLDGLNNIRSFSLSEYKVSSIPDNFGNDQMALLEEIWFSNNKLKNFPANLNLGSVKELRVMWNELTDTEFLKNYPSLIDVDLSYNKISMLNDLEGGLSIETLELYGNAIDDISSATSLKKLKRLRIPNQLSEQAQTLDLPLEKNRAEHKDSAQFLEAKSTIENLDQGKYYQLTINDDVQRAISRAMDEKNADVMAFLLSHPDQDVYEYVIRIGLYSINSRQLRIFEEKCLVDIGRLVPALISAFNYYYENWDHWSFFGGRFYNGRFKDAHIKILSIAMEIAGPNCSELFRLYLEDYEGFSVYHETAYKRLFGVIKKTKDQSLVNYIIRTIPCEKNILGGDAAYLKKALNAVKSLGNQSHLSYLQETWESLGETREDVVKVYFATHKALEKRSKK